jgi:hypothetical protein
MGHIRKNLLKKASKKKKKKLPKGEDDLFNQVIALTGIPAQTIKRELKSILDRKNIDVNSLTLDQLRAVVASYLREIMGGLLDRYSHKKSELNH